MTVDPVGDAEWLIVSMMWFESFSYYADGSIAYNRRRNTYHRGAQDWTSRLHLRHHLIVISVTLYRRDYRCRWWESLNPRHSIPSVKLFKLITMRRYDTRLRFRRARFCSFGTVPGRGWRICSFIIVTSMPAWPLTGEFSTTRGHYRWYCRNRLRWHAEFRIQYITIVRLTVCELFRWSVDSIEAIRDYTSYWHS